MDICSVIGGGAMLDLISQTERKARKDHTCNYCGEKIEKGETYRSAFLKDGGDVYQWKGHLRCNIIATALWRYIDPDDGMQEEDFQEGCAEFCYAFVCPDCEFFKDRECTQEKAYCLDKITEILKENRFIFVKTDYVGNSHWKLIPRKKEEENWKNLKKPYRIAIP